jgi:hypothetical protein
VCTAFVLVLFACLIMHGGNTKGKKYHLLRRKLSIVWDVDITHGDLNSVDKTNLDDQYQV